MPNPAYIFITTLGSTKCQLPLPFPALPSWGTNEKVHVKAAPSEEFYLLRASYYGNLIRDLSWDYSGDIETIGAGMACDLSLFQMNSSWASHGCAPQIFICRNVFSLFISPLRFSTLLEFSYYALHADAMSKSWCILTLILFEKQD